MYAELIKKLGIPLTNEQLLKIALTHRSFRKEHPERTEGLPSNERLEFLGDSVLNCITASWIFEKFPEYNEGDLSSLRSSLVKMTTLARFARELHLGTYVRISRSEDLRAGRNREALLADVFEAILGAIYLDQGMDVVTAFVIPFLEQETERVLTGQAEMDYRTQLQKLLQSKYGITPTYRTIDVTGPDHRRQFTVEVLQQDTHLGTGTGPSKQAAAQQAARVALRMLQEDDLSHS